MFFVPAHGFRGVGNRYHFTSLKVNCSPDGVAGVAVGLLIVVLSTYTTVTVIPTAFPNAQMYLSMLFASLAIFTIALLYAFWSGNPGIVFPQAQTSDAEIGGGATSSNQKTVADLIRREFDSFMEVQPCRHCEVLVEGFDHHCGVLGACVGRKNMWAFLMFLAFVSLHAFVTFALNLALLWQIVRMPAALTAHSFFAALNFEVVASGLCCAACVYGGLFAFAMGLNHSYNVYQGLDSYCRKHRLVEGLSLPRTKLLRFSKVFQHAKLLESSFSLFATVLRSQQPTDRSSLLVDTEMASREAI